MNKIILFGLAVFTTIACSDDLRDEKDVSETASNYNYSFNEMETMRLINEYRVNEGLEPLIHIDYISIKSEEHTNNMLVNNQVNHNGFSDRSNDIIKTLGAKKVGENVAYNYNSAQSVLNAWLKSPGHKKLIEGDFTNFGISIREHSSNGKLYYTNIFVKI
jgi:uncharacterized protein YkwD